MKLVRNRPFKRTVHVRFPAEDGVEFEEVSFTAHFEALTTEEAEEFDMRNREGREVFLRRVLKGFDGVIDDATGAPLPVTPENIDLLIRDSFVSPALIQTFIATMAGAPRKN